MTAGPHLRPAHPPGTSARERPAPPAATVAATADGGLTPRVGALRDAVLAARPAVCGERAVLVTRYARLHGRVGPPDALAKAQALAYVLEHKRVAIHPHELLVGGFTAHRVGGSVYPELHGIAMLEDLLRFGSRSVNPLALSRSDRNALLLEVLPFWLFRFLALRAFRPLGALRFLADQLRPTEYLINESAGIAHFVPDYERLVTRGTDGLRDEIDARLRREVSGSRGHGLLSATRVVCDALDAFAQRYRVEALRQLAIEEAPGRRADLEAIARVCQRAPRTPARTLQEGLQTILFAQIALNLESLDNGISPGRLDQILLPVYRRDLVDGRLDESGAFELLACFSIKLCELVPVLSGRITRFHGGLMSGQAVVVGGTDADGRDATNELSYLFLEVMDRLRMRQPNFHARLHPDSPSGFRHRIARALASGSVSPALYNDAVIVPALVRRGVPASEARTYATVGCVEPSPAGSAFLSTDAALVNLPLCLELALNQGRRFGHKARIGAPTPPAEGCRSAEDLLGLFEVQLARVVERLLGDLAAIERANSRWHPTPLASLLVRGCIDSALDVTEGGAIHNGSGLQGVGAVDVGDALAAVKAVVFDGLWAPMSTVVAACRAGFRGHAALQERLSRAPKFGNDDPMPDAYVGRVMESFARTLEGRVNTRGGPYVAGFYSMTCHEAFGKVVGALPSGRTAGEPFSSGLSPSHGAARRGPTALLMSVARLPLTLAANGVNLNLELAPWLVAGRRGGAVLEALLRGAFDAGVMQVQLNVLDRRTLEEAREAPGRHPGLIVRVSGYSAYFEDLSPAMRQEIIDRFIS